MFFNFRRKLAKALRIRPVMIETTNKVGPVLPIKPDAVGKAIFIYARAWADKDDKTTNFRCGPAPGAQYPQRSGVYNLPRELFQKAVRSYWGGDVTDPHHTIIVEIFKPGERETVVLLGGQEVTITNQDLLNGITDAEEHDLLFDVPFVHQGKRAYLREENPLYYGTAGEWFRFLAAQDAERKAAAIAREEQIRRMAAAA